MHTPTLSTTVPFPIGLIAISTAADWDHRSYSAKNTSVDSTDVVLMKEFLKRVV